MRRIALATMVVVLALVGTPSVASNINDVAAVVGSRGVFAAGFDRQQGEGVVTWAVTQDGDVSVIWASSSALLIVDSNGRPLAPRFTGMLSASEVSEAATSIGAQLSTAGREATAQAVTLLCSLAVPNPWWDWAVDQAKSSSSQTCSGHTAQRLRGELREDTWWVFYAVRDSEDSGVVARDNVFVSMGGPCATSATEEWQNFANGDAWQGSTFFDGPSVATNWIPLGCDT